MKIREKGRRTTSLESLAEVAGDATEALIDPRSESLHSQVELDELIDDPVARRAIEAAKSGAAPCNHDRMGELPRVRLKGDVEGDYVVLQRHAGGVLRIAPEQPEGQPKVVALKKTSLACPSQWEGVLEDGRVIYARYRWGELSVGVGDSADEAVRNGMSDDALYADPVSGGLDGYMNFEELKAHLHGLLEFPATLIVENERPPNLDPEGLAELLVPPRED